MADKTMDEVLANITDLRSKEQGLENLTAHLHDQVQAALASLTIPPEVQAKINAAFEAVDTSKAEVIAAIDANTDVAHPSTEPVR